MAKRKRVQLVQIEVDGVMVDAKECTKCGEVKALGEFSRNNMGLGGRKSQCKECRAEYGRKRYEENREQIAEYSREYYKKNRERLAEYNREWREENRGKVLGYYRKYYEKNRGKRAKYARRWYEENRRRVSANKRKWREENPEKARETDQRRRARKAGLPDDMSDRRWEEIVNEDFDGVCALTGESTGLHLEHFIPVAISHGGTYDGNVYPLIGELNLSKQDANPFEWIKRPDISERISAGRWESLVSYLADKNGLTVEEFREFVYWCFDNPRTPEQAAKDTKRGITSLDLWRASKLRAASNE